MSFEAAAEVVVSGDAQTLTGMLREEPSLIQARSEREHRATLLHYVSANGVEEFRQKTPPNIVAITDLLLDSGAEINAAADVYGGGCTTLDLAATSIHPERAGVQNALLATLLHRGARMEAGGQSIVMDCLGNNRLRAAEFLADRGARVGLAAAAGLGRLQTVQKLFDGNPNEAFVYACRYGHNPVAEFLLDHGADIQTQQGGQTGLHWAVIGGHLETVNLLLRHHAPLQIENRYGGTVLGQTLWSAAHGGDPEIYHSIVETLVAAGAH